MGLVCWGGRSNSNVWAFTDRVDVFGACTVVGCRLLVVGWRCALSEVAFCLNCSKIAMILKCSSESMCGVLWVVSLVFGVLFLLLCGVGAVVGVGQVFLL